VRVRRRAVHRGGEARTASPLPLFACPLPVLTFVGWVAARVRASECGDAQHQATLREESDVGRFDSCVAPRSPVTHAARFSAATCRNQLDSGFQTDENLASSPVSEHQSNDPDVDAFGSKRRRSCQRRSSF
jgi:hypothetical protein